ncbi:hypothetical protein [Microbacterium sp. YY-01]|uniref:hypothetical protein n=1 Tax=Microbacterium sp. YY-01 TaxID=3421634 RepID=UPI003D184FEB
MSFADMFRSALSARGLTLSGLKRILDERGMPVALSTLSYWRSASRQPDAEKQHLVIAEIEEILELDSGALDALALRPSSARPLIESYDGLPSGSEVIEALIKQAELDLKVTPTAKLQELSQTLTTDVGIDGFPVRHRIRTLMQCVEGSLSRVMWSVPMEFGGASSLVLTVMVGADAGHWIDPGDRLHAVAIDLDPPLRRGDTVMLEIRCDFLERARTQMSAGIFENHRAQKLVNWVRFHPDALPDWAIEVERAEGGEVRRWRSFDAPTSIHQARWDFGPGAIQLDWGYGEPPVWQLADQA